MPTPILMGIINVTPDSFHDGGRLMCGGKPQRLRVLKLARRLIEEGATILDIGGESTRPGAKPVSLLEERARVIPVVSQIAGTFPRIKISVDTQKSAVAQEALSLGAHMINDISALREDAAMAQVVARARAEVILMHMQGTPQTMQRQPRYRDVVQEVRAFLKERIQFAYRAGIQENKIWVDPGIGFGKTVAHNIEILRRIDEFHTLGVKVILGASRKSFIGKILGGAKNPLATQARLEGSLAVALHATAKGVTALRIHDVGATQRAIQVWRKIT